MCCYIDGRIMIFVEEDPPPRKLISNPCNVGLGASQLIHFVLDDDDDEMKNNYVRSRLSTLEKGSL